MTVAAEKAVCAWVKPGVRIHRHDRRSGAARSGAYTIEQRSPGGAGAVRAGRPPARPVQRMGC